jgi:hypothetical protein
VITEIPDRDDFWTAGLSMLNLAWDTVSTLYQDLEFSELEQWDDAGEVTDEYWLAARQPISVALALTQQGIELLLKARIAEVSPFLLISGSPREWPSGCGQRDTPFADFQTIDAHELVRAHDAVVSQRVDDSFKEQVERLRRVRNVVFHGVSREDRPSGVEVWRVILEAVENLGESRSWLRIRQTYLENSPQGVAWSTDRTDIILVWEFEKLIKLLGPAELRRFFGFEKGQRHYICHTCACRCINGNRPRIAFLKPNTPTSTSLYCPICDESYEVIRRKCGEAGCRGNVLHPDGEVCLTCFHQGSPPH